MLIKISLLGFFQTDINLNRESLANIAIYEPYTFQVSQYNSVWNYLLVCLRHKVCIYSYTGKTCIYSHIWSIRNYFYNENMHLFYGTMCIYSMETYAFTLRKRMHLIYGNVCIYFTETYACTFIMGSVWWVSNQCLRYPKKD